MPVCSKLVSGGKECEGKKVKEKICCSKLGLGGKECDGKKLNGKNVGGMK